MTESKTKKIKDMLKCLLSESEIKECGMDLARANSSVTELEAQKKKFNDQVKADISGHEAAIAKLSSMIQNGYEYRQVDCEIQIDSVAKTIYWVRLDTGEEYKNRPMTPDELQEKLFDGQEN